MELELDDAGDPQLLPGVIPTSMVERMTLILDLFTTREELLPLEQIARRTGLPRSTAHRILDQLVRLDWLQHAATGYGLGRRSLGLGGGHGENDRLRSVASPYLQDLLLRTGAVVHLAVLHGGRVQYLDKLGGRSAVVVPSRVGGTAPAHCTALGKAMLAWLPPEEVDERLGSRREAPTRQSLAQPEALHQELARIRTRSGLAIEHGECFPDIACVAAAVRGPLGPVAAVSLVVTNGAALERAAPLLVGAVRRVTAELYPEHVRRDQHSAFAQIRQTEARAIG